MTVIIFSSQSSCTLEEGKEKIDPYSLKKVPMESVFFTLVCVGGGRLHSFRPIVALHYSDMCRSIPVVLHNWINIIQQFMAHN